MTDLTALGFTEDTDETQNTQLPKVRIAQSMTPEVTSGLVTPGQIMFQGRETQPSLRMVPLAREVRQILFAKGDQEGVLCYSHNSILGEGDPGGACGECPLNQWTENPGAKTNTPPKCTRVIEYLVAVLPSDPEDQMLVGILPFKRSGIKVAQTIDSLFTQHGRKFGRFAIEFSAVPKRNGHGQFFVPQVRYIKVPADTFAEVGEYLASISGNGEPIKALPGEEVSA